MKRALPFALVLSAIGACTFPGVDYSNATDGSLPDQVSSSGADASSSSSGASSGGSSGASDAAQDHMQSADSPADVVTSDTTSSSSSGGEAGACDMDGDGFLAKGPPCNGNDCCDTDAKANPAQTMFFSMPDKCGSYDYNCDGTVTPEYSANLTCSGVPAVTCFYDCPTNSCTCGGTKCNYGYLGADPGCGNGAPYGTCTSNMLGTACVTTTTVQSQTQACN
jgi:hypothetical protein